MERINLIIKPTDFCNLRCKYCYNSYSEYKKQVLSDERLEKMLTVVAKRFNEIVIIWHGGEPTCVGLDYYKRAMEIEKRVAFHSGAKFSNRMQSNGTNFNEEWVHFIKENDFKVGISFDGIHNDTYRGGSEKTLRSMELFKKNGIRFGAMAVVVDGDYDLVANYEFFKEKKIPIEFTHVISEGGAKELKQLSASQYATAMCRLFDHWLCDLEGVPVRTFKSYTNLALGGPELICNHGSCHSKYLCINSDGNIYNCSRESVHEYCLGNIDEVSSVEEMYASEGFKALLRGSITRRNICKESCEYFNYCKGGCADVAICEGSLDTPPEYSCYVFRTVFSHVKNKVGEIFANNTSLATLNPAFRESVVSCMGVRENYSLR